jgi:hypothetical protein
VPGIQRDVVVFDRAAKLLGQYPDRKLVQFNSFKNDRVHGLRYETRAEMTAMSFEYIEV